MKKNNHARKFAPAGIIFAILGLVLFGYFVRKAGVSEIVDGIKRLGVGFLLIIVISGLRHTVRALAWMRCVEQPYCLRFRDVFAARLMGDALGNVIPLASIAVAEPSKAVFVRHRIPLIAGLSSIALENMFYGLSVILFIFSGISALLLSFSLPKALRYASIGALIVSVLVAVLGYLVVRKQWRFLSRALKSLDDRGVARDWMLRLTPRAESLEDRVYGFYERNRGRLLQIFGLEVCFHLAGVTEVYTTLAFISGTKAPTLLTAFILESVNRVINVAFKFVPLRTGVDEAGTGMLSKVLGYTTAIGVTLAIVRKARDIFWSSIGIALIVRRGLSIRSAAIDAEDVVDEIDATAGDVQELPAGGLRKSL